MFVGRKTECEEVSNFISSCGFVAASLHGDKHQEEREEVITAFRSNVVPILVATDVAGVLSV